MVIKKVVILLLLMSLWGCALTSYKTVELVKEKDQYTGTEILDTMISFPQATSQTQVIFRQMKSGDNSSTLLIGRFWMENWGFFESADIMIDNNNFHLEAVDTKRNVLNNASVEEVIYIDINDKIIDEFSKCNSLRMRFNGEKNVRECIFDTNKINMIKRWIDHINNS